MAAKAKSRSAPAPEPAATPAGWRNRIVGSGVKPASEFTPHPNNWRLHPQAQREAVRASLDTLGWIAQVIENVRTGYLIDGHDRVQDALDNDDAPVPYIQVDLTEAEERQALATYDPLSAMAVPDPEKLDALVTGLRLENSALDTLVEQMRAESSLSVSVQRQLDTNPNAGRDLGDAKKMIKPVLYAEQLETFELAILATGIANRGDALIHICEAYLAAKR